MYCRSNDSMLMMMTWHISLLSTQQPALSSLHWLGTLVVLHLSHSWRHTFVIPCCCTRVSLLFLSCSLWSRDIESLSSTPCLYYSISSLVTIESSRTKQCLPAWVTWVSWARVSRVRRSFTCLCCERVVSLDWSVVYYIWAQILRQLCLFNSKAKAVNQRREVISSRVLRAFWKRETISQLLSKSIEGRRTLLFDKL